MQKKRNLIRGPMFGQLHQQRQRTSNNECPLAASRRLGQSRNKTPVSLCTTPTASSSPTSISRKSPVDAPQPSCSRKMRRDGSRRILRGCRSYCGIRSGSFFTLSEIISVSRVKASTLNSFQGCLEQHRMTARRFPPLWFIGHGALCKTMTTTPIMQAIRTPMAM